MDTHTHHGMTLLFEQLGLDDSPQAIADFIDAHKGLAPDLRLSEAPFWSDSQAAFLRETISDDGEWALVIDSLSSSLRAPVQVS